MATPLHVAAALQRHKHILVGEEGETVDQLWQRAATFTARVCRDVRDQYALIAKPGGRRCTVDGLRGTIDCDKIIDRATLRIYDLVVSGGAPNASPGFGETDAMGRHEDFVEPPTYEGDENPVPPAAPGAPANPPKPIILPDRGEMMTVGQQLHFYYRSPEGLQRPQGLWKDATATAIAQPDWEGIGAWLFDVYLRARVAGKSATEAFELVIKEIRKSDEWKTKHPGETP